MIYGTYHKTVIKDKKDLLTSINTTKHFDNKSFARIMPILDKNNIIHGAIVFNYRLVATQKIESKMLYLINNALLFSPFIFIIIFTLIYAKKLSKDINRPVKLLLNASEKIKNQDLDFTIDYNENNEFTNLCSAFEDMRINLKDSLIKQWDLEETRKENIASIAHDLKTPLSIINSYSEALIDGNVGEEKRKDYIITIKRNNERALKLLENIKKISLIENPNFTLEPEKTDIRNFIELKEKDYKLLCEKKGIIFKTTFNDLRNDNVIANFDIRSIEQALDNCIYNSLRYTEKNETIQLNVLFKDDDVEFSIMDTGQGFSKEDLRNIFNKFYKGDKSRSFTSGHSGLGMYIAKTIVEIHGGKIVAKNNHPKGAIIQFNVKPIGNN